MYSSRHNHALRRSREGSGRFVGGPVENLSEGSSNISSMPSSLASSYHQSDPNVVTTTSTDNYMPFSHQVETLHGPHQDSPQSNTNNNHSLANEEVILLKPPSSKETSVDNSESKETVITNVAVS